MSFCLKKAFIPIFTLSILLLSLNSKAQESESISGVVKDESSGDPLAGVSVVLLGTSNGTITDDNGAYELTQVNSSDTLKFSFLGYTDKLISVRQAKSQDEVLLTPGDKALDEVVVIGYGTEKKGNVLGSVATFNTDNLDERPVGRIDQALVGEMPGVRVKQTSGIPGHGLSVQIRGSGSISAGDEPLYVVDGFPITGASPNGSGNYSNGNPLDNLNPNDIESIQVLKDAASAAIYGSRAANGVVIITTKHGKKGAPEISLNAYAGFSERSKKLDMLDGQEWANRATEMINAQWEASGPGRSASQSNEERRQILGLSDGEVNTKYMIDPRWAKAGHPGLQYIDWQDEAFRKGLQQNYELSARGGTDVVRYFISGNYSNQQGMIKNLDYKDYSARANVDVTPNDHLQFGIKIAPTYSESNNPGVEGKDNILHELVGMTPVQEDTMGLYPNVGKNGQYRWGTSRNSPIGELENIIAKTKKFRTLATIYGQYELTNGLQFKSTLNVDNTNSDFKRYIPYTVTGSLESRESRLTENTSGAYNGYHRLTFVNENTISYHQIFNEVHSVSGVVGFSYNYNKLNNYGLSSKDGFNSSVVTTLNAANAISGSTTETKNILLSYFGRLQYAYNDKYLFSGSIRRDGSSRFGANTKWGWFPSLSVGWRISQESFMEGISGVLSNLKLRASWGEAGNYNIGDYSSIPVLSTYNYSFNGKSAVGQAPSNIVDPDLTWEKSRTMNVGFDFGVLKNRITGSFDYYVKENTSLLMNVAIPEASGFSSTLANIGKVENKGWELDITSRNLIGDFKWKTTANISYNTNKLKKLPDGQTRIYVPSSFDISHSVLQVGKPLYSINVVKQIGILTQEDIDNGAALFGSETVGDPKYYDANRDGVIDADDRVIVGHPNPDYIWGITNTFSYKGFDLSILIQGQWGGSIYSLFGRAVNRTGTGVADNVLGSWAHRWRSPSNPGNGEVGKAYSTFGRIKNTDWLYPSDYIRVRNITLGYDLGRILKTSFLKNSRLYVSAENFFGHDKYTGGFNPEAANTNLSGSGTYPEPGDYGGLPLPKSLIFGVNLTF